MVPTYAILYYLDPKIAKKKINDDRCLFCTVISYYSQLLKYNIIITIIMMMMMMMIMR